MKKASIDGAGAVTGFYSEDVHGPFDLPVYGDAPPATEEDPSPQRPVTGTKPNPAYPEGCVDVTDDQWQRFIDDPFKLRWDADRKDFVAYAPPPAPPVVPETISDRQFFQQLAVVNLVTQDEALAYVSAGALPKSMTDLIAKLPADAQFGAKMVVIGATSFFRHDPLTVQMITLYGMSAADADAFWTAAALL